MLLNYESANSTSKQHFINRTDGYGSQSEIEILVFDRVLTDQEEQIPNIYQINGGLIHK